MLDWPGIDRARADGERDLLRHAVIVALLAAPAAAPVAAQVVNESEVMAGIGIQGCETIRGVENASTLAQAADWALGYMAGRRDGGHSPVDGTPLSTVSPTDLAVSISLYCREYPHAVILDALRDYGTRVFAEGPEADPALQPRLPQYAPRARPDEWPPVVAETLDEDGQEGGSSEPRPRPRPTRT